ncbi:MAG TPA: PilC/PilY family type IV pilus protein [Steroidobacteraceae bacterium]
MDMQLVRLNSRRAAMIVATLLIAVTAGTGHSAPPPAPISIAQVPLTIAVPAHPQIVLAIGNSESMDGNLSGAIMAGSGSLPVADNLLQNSSSPANFLIPAGFTPPVNPGVAGSAPYTVNVGGHLVDNSPSRLNVAKAGVTAVLNTFMANADFALLDYQTGGPTIYTTWVYQMSPAGGFVFTNAQVVGNRYVANPCLNHLALPAGNTVRNDCIAIATSGQVTGSVNTSQYMQISTSSDDPLINDVLYAGGLSPVCLVYGGPAPASPYPPAPGSYPLATYNGNPGNVRETYSHSVNPCATQTSPTNAGFVPFAPQTMYIQRGFGYGAGQSATSATTVVGMTSAGQFPTGATVATAIAKFTPFLQPETNVVGTTEIKASAGQSALPGLLKGAGAYYTTANPPSTNGCAADRYVVLLTDGLPTLDLAGHSWPPPGTTSASPNPTGWGVSVQFNGDGSLNPIGTNAQAVIDTINQLALLKAANIKTYIIGLGAGVDPLQNPTAAQVLTAMAIAGGTGTYFAATSPTDLTNDMQVILAKILAATQATSSTAVNTTGLHNGSVAYLAQFTTSDANQDWTGDLGAYPIDPVSGQVNTAPASALWRAQAQLDGQAWDAGRIIATWDPVARAGTPFRWTPALAPAGISATTVLGTALQTFPPDTNGQDVLHFLRGSSAQEVRNGGQFRNRTHKLGDIVGSAPVYVGKPTGFTQTAAYFTFSTLHAARSPMVYIGANDGMLHGFDATTGAERFAFIPNGVFNNLVSLANPYYNENHQFYVNGSPVVADVQFSSDGTWHTVLVANEGAGGKTLFAMDVTDPDSINTEPVLSSRILWEFSDVDMGLSFSEPAFANTINGWMVLFGNGYNSANQKPVLYMVNPQTGATQAKVDLCAAVAGVCNAALANGLSSVTAINSFGQVSAFADTVYAGDLQGNVWRVDISNPNPALWVVKVIYQARDAGGAIQPITTVPAVTLNPQYPALLGTMIMVGTGQLLGYPDLTTTGVQTLYGIYDAPTGAAPPVGFAGIPNRTNLVQQTLVAAVVSGVNVRIEPTVNPVALPGQRGWYLDFNLASGERIVTDPKIESGGGVVLTTYQPNTSSCTGGGNAWLMVLNYATGGSFPLPELDVNGDGKLDNNDMSGNNNPVGMSLGAVYASSATIAASSSCTTAACNHKMAAVSSVKIASVADRGSGKQRTAWWEVRH